ncbi:MAG: hypothetical protein EA425_08310 [Puniceicoccaceae bacterium]|nr:MAG: hypothetical protein EA425_08310 [Puniceicoccaceae bacterium]
MQIIVMTESRLSRWIFLTLFSLLGQPALHAVDLDEAWQTLIPKRETGALEFLQQHPEADGRGIVVAVLDTGVDPAAAGLQTTSDGKRKLVDVIDASGAGDVRTTATATPDEEGRLTGLSGRTLLLPDDLVNPEDTFRLGLKYGEDLFTSGLWSRILEHRKERLQAEIERQQAERLRALARQRAAGERAFEDKAEADLTLAERDRLARERLLEAWEKRLLEGDPGPLIDCVLWHDGEHWRALIDTRGDGDLRNQPALRPFGVAGEFGVFDERVPSSYAIQVYEDGDLLSIVTADGSHGTHVAAIIAAHHPEQPQRNGLAPGARILSIKIGDSRRGGGSDMTGEMRAAALAARHGVDILNASWGGATSFQDGSGLADQFVDRLAEEFGVISFLSVGNHGPALSTLGSPGGESKRTIGVGGVISPAMGRYLYSHRHLFPDAAFGFTGRGPTKTGDLGVNLVAPGAAIASTARDSLNESSLMQGTSMSSPSAAGVGALLLSAARQRGLETTPARVRALFMNAARPMDGIEVFAQGAGLIQIGPALELLETAAGIAAFDAFYDIECGINPHASGPGIYFREPPEPGPFETRIGITPAFLDRVPAEEQAAFSVDLTLRSTVDWIRPPEYIHLTNRRVFIRPEIEPPPAPENGSAVHFGEIHAFVADHENLGPLFRIPVTLIQPRRVGRADRFQTSWTTELQPGAVAREFILPPEGASHLQLRIIRHGDDLNRRSFHATVLSLQTHRAYTATRSSSWIHLAPSEPEEQWVEIVPGRTAEIALHQPWNTEGTNQLSVEIRFAGVHTSDPLVAIPPNSRFATLHLPPSLTSLEARATARVEEAAFVLAPAKHEIVPLDERSTLPPGPDREDDLPRFALRQKFELDLNAAGTYRLYWSHPFTTRSHHAGGLVHVFHESGRRIAIVSPWGRPSIELPKGKIHFHRDLKAVDRAQLERDQHHPLILTRRLPSPIALHVHSRPEQALEGDNSPTVNLRPRPDQQLNNAQHRPHRSIKLTPAPQFFLGSVSLATEGHTWFSSNLMYHPPVAAPEQRPSRSPSTDPSEPPDRDLRDRVFRQRLDWARGQLTARPAARIKARDTLIAELLEERPDDPDALLLAIQVEAHRAGLLPPLQRGPASPSSDASSDENGASDNDESGEKEEADPENDLDTGETEIAETDAETDADTEQPSETPEKPKAEIAADLEKRLTDLAENLHPDRVAAFFGAPEPTEDLEPAERRRLDRERTEHTADRNRLFQIHLTRSRIALAIEETEPARSALREARRWTANQDRPPADWRRQQLNLLQAEGHLGLALDVLESHLLEDNPLSHPLRQRRLDLLESLGWSKAAAHERLLLAVERNAGDPVF